MKKALSKTLTCLAGATLLCALPVEANAGDEVLAKAGEAVYSADEFQKVLEQMDSDSLRTLAENPAALNQTVRRLLVERLVLAKALEREWEQEEEVAALIEKARKKVIVESFLNAVSEPPNGSPTETEVKAVYDANQGRFEIPRQMLLSQIVISRPSSDDDPGLAQTMEKVSELKSALAEPSAEFSTVALAMSDDARTARNGGRIGWVRVDQLNPKIADAVQELEVGARTGVIELDDGWYVVEVRETRDPYTPSFDEVKGVLAEEIRKQARVARRQAYMAGLLKENPITVNEMGLAAMIEQSEVAVGAESGGARSVISESKPEEASDEKKRSGLNLFRR